MSVMMNKSSYEGMIKENLEWLAKQPYSCERMHIECILKGSTQREYDDQDKIEKYRGALEILAHHFETGFNLPADVEGSRHEIIRQVERIAREALKA